jgi:hypothetical protein
MKASEKIKKILVGMAMSDDLPIDMNNLDASVFDKVFAEENQNKIILDMNDVFDSDEVDKAHAIDTIGNFLKKIIDKGEINESDVQIETFSGSSDVEDIRIELAMEEMICDAIRTITNKLMNAVSKRENQNRKILEGITVCLDRK